MAQFRRGPCSDEVTVRLTLDELIALKNICRIAHEEANVNEVPEKFEKFLIAAESSERNEYGEHDILGSIK